MPVVSCCHHTPHTPPAACYMLSANTACLISISVVFKNLSTIKVEMSLNTLVTFIENKSLGCNLSCTNIIIFPCHIPLSNFIQATHTRQLLQCHTALLLRPCAADQSDPDTGADL